MIGLPLLGGAVASYLTLYQSGLVASIWEPIFQDGSRTILHSKLAQALPVPDAAVGAVGYLTEATCVAVGWDGRLLVGVVYGATVIIFAVVSAALLVAQGAYFHTWCTLCTISALISFAIAGLAAREWRTRQ